MRKLLFCAAALLFALSSVAQRRISSSLDFGWRFMSGDVPGASSAQFDDSQWRIINVPHDFQIEQPWVAPSADEKADNDDPAANIKSRLSSRGFKEMGTAWYRYHLTPNDSLKNRRILLDFGGIMYVGDVFLNGEYIGGTNYGYVGFEIDITNKLKFNQDNVIAVKADTRDPFSSRWYTGGGLFRQVRLISTAKEAFLQRNPLRIVTHDNRFSTIYAEVAMMGKEKILPIDVVIKDPKGNCVYSGKTEIKRNTPTRFVEQKIAEVEIANAELWDCEHPNLYTVEVVLHNAKGDVLDSYSEHFGFRTIEITPEHGLKLNGKKVLLKGYANHHSLGALGAAAYPRAIEKRIQLMKKYGINHIRTSHNPYSREFIELCDKYGILVVDELYDKWTRQHTGGRVAFEELWQHDVPEWVKRDRNSPSVVLWSLGNELQQDPNQPFNDFGVTMYQLMKTLVLRYDSTRLVTVAMHPRYRNWATDSLPCDLAMKTDVQAYNYRYMYFPGDGRRFPWMKFYQSEASVSAMGQNYFEMDREKVIGLAYWGAIDYLGESQGWPAKGWSQGVFDLELNPKPKAYYMKSFFCPDEPVVHIGVIEKKGDQMWNGVQTGNDGMSDHWNRIAGQHLSLVTYTNADEVELLLNGKSLGVKKNDVKNAKMRNQIRWNDIVYQPGKLEAIARTKGKIVARHQIETTKAPVRLKAESDNNNWKADGVDLQHIRITALDAKGRLVQTTNEDVTFTVDGNAQIVGVVNGDINSDELHVDNHRRLFNGSCTVILRSTREAGVITLKVQAAGMKPVVLKLSTKE